MSKYEILVVDDHQSIINAFKMETRHLNVKVTGLLQATTAIEMVEQYPRRFCCVFLDQNLGSVSGHRVAEALRKSNPNIVISMITGETSAAIINSFLQASVDAYFPKPLDFPNRIIPSLLSTFKRHDETIRVCENLSGNIMPFKETGLIGSSEAIKELNAQVGSAAKSMTASVLLLGENGTGKELCARAIHRLTCPEKPFMAINCPAISASLIESELFGHIKGAFTGAQTDKVGKLQAAGDGVVFLDEIGDMPFELQAKLLRVLENREIQPVGSNKTVKFNARVIAATNANLQGAIREGRFRQDLFYRLNTFTINLPALRDRREDIEPLIMFFKNENSKWEKIDILMGVMERLKSFNWPGNVRELKNTMTRLFLKAEESGVVELKHLDSHFFNPVTQFQASRDFNSLAEITAAAESYRMKLVKKILEESNFNNSEAARHLQCSEGTVRRLATILKNKEKQITA